MMQKPSPLNLPEEQARQGEPPKRLAIYVEFDLDSEPDLFHALASVPKGKLRARRLRFLATKGLLCDPSPTARCSAGAAAPVQRRLSASDVFDDPLSE